MNNKLVIKFNYVKQCFVEKQNLVVMTVNTLKDYFPSLHYFFKKFNLNVQVNKYIAMFNCFIMHVMM